LFVFDGLFLLRFADRQFVGLLFHEPPRNTRQLFGPAPSQHTVHTNDTIRQQAPSSILGVDQGLRPWT
jgi:hypothetical protein